MLIAGSVLIGGQKGKAWGNSRVCAGGKPVDDADYHLVDFVTTLEIRVFEGGGGGVDMYARSVRGLGKGFI